MEFSQAQQEAIKSKDVNIVVSASAGAGKTTVLVERLMKRMFIDGVSLDEILAMTFTEAAAGNMKKKLIKALNKKILDPELAQSEKEFCEKQIILVQNALICTIHSFSQTIIKNNYAAIGLDPEIIENIIDDVTAYKLEVEALNIILKEELDHNFMQYNNLLKYISSDIYHVDTLNKYLLQISKTARNTIDENAWYAKIIALNQEVNDFSQIPLLFKEPFINDINIKITKTINKLQELELMASSNEKGQPQLISDITSKFKQAKKSLTSDYSQAIANLKIALNVKIKSIPKFEEYKELRNEILSDNYQSLIPYLIEPHIIVSRFNETARINCYLLSLAQRLAHNFQALKVKNKAMDFSDMEHYAYQILKANDFEVSKDYQVKLKEIMVDEFQDTNDIQNAMVEMISNGHNVFRVGDMKQSIYKFRGAKPTIMQSLINDESIKKIYLPNNYRSSANIVSFNNLVFKDLLQDSNVNINFTDLDTQITELDYQFKDLAPIELVSFVKNQEKAQIKSNPVASWICRDIIDKVKSNKYQFKDLCILVRGHADKIDLKYELNKANIPNFVDDHSGYLSSYSATTIINYFKIILDPHDNLAFTAILASPLYNFSDDELVKYFSRAGYYEALKEINHQVIIDYQRLKGVYYKFGILELFNELMILNNYYHTKISKQEKVDLDLLVDNIINFKSNSLVSFLEYIKIAEEKTKNDAIPISNEANVVKVMTIHHSKGLEFEVCYLYTPNKSPLVKPQDNLVIDEQLGIGINYVMDEYLTTTSIQKQAIIHRNQIEELSEFIRIFYVATTRPKNRLYIVEKENSTTFDQKEISIKLNDRLNFTDLLAASSIKDADIFNHQILNSDSIMDYDYLPVLNPKHSVIKINEKIITTLEKTIPSEGGHDIELNFSRGQEIGNLYHQAMEKLPYNKLVNIEIIKELNPKLNDDQVKKIYNCYHSDFFQVLIGKDFHCEYNFTRLVNNKLKTGIVDFIAMDNENIYIVDYKTDTNISESELKIRYQKQLNEYKTTFKGIFSNKNVFTYIYSFNLETFIQV